MLELVHPITYPKVLKSKINLTHEAELSKNTTRMAMSVFMLSNTYTLKLSY